MIKKNEDNLIPFPIQPEPDDGNDVFGAGAEDPVDDELFKSFEYILHDHVGTFEDFIRQNSQLVSNIFGDDIASEEIALLEKGDFAALVGFWQAILEAGDSRDRWVSLKLAKAYNLNNEPDKSLKITRELYRQYHVDPSYCLDVERLIITSLYLKGETENNFNWINGLRLKVVKSGDDAIDLCYQLVTRTTTRFAPNVFLSELYSDLQREENCFALFPEEELLESLCRDNRFDVRFDPDDESDRLIRLRDWQRILETKEVYQFKITLKRSNPAIWRRVLVPAEMQLWHFHEVIQICMGWAGRHLYQFEIGDSVYGDPTLGDEFYFDPVENDREYRLDQLELEQDKTFCYNYDLGDSWEHEIILEKVRKPENNRFYPRCARAVNAGPPEDCGGIEGYYHLLESLGDAKHPGYRHMTEFLGDDFDPAYASVSNINNILEVAFD